MFGLLLAMHCLFTPPEGWEIADPKTPSKRAVASFVDKRKSGFCPSLNLTYEKVTIPTEEYLSIVQKNSKAKKQVWKHLGKIDTKSGQAELIEIETKNNLGQIRLMQALLRNGDDLFILTGGTLKKDFGKNAPSIEKAIHSMELVPDLFSIIKDVKLRESLQSLNEKDKDLFQKEVLHHKELGPVWQLLILKIKPSAENNSP